MKSKLRKLVLNLYLKLTIDGKMFILLFSKILLKLINP